MSEFESHYSPQRHPLLSLFLILLVAGLGFIVVGPIIGFFFALPFYSGSMMDLVNNLQNTADGSIKLPLYIIQGFATFVGLIIAPAWFLTTEGRSLKSLFPEQRINLMVTIAVVFLVTTFMGVNSVAIEWNSSVDFPDWAKGFETWAKEKEEVAAEMTKYLTAFDSGFQVLLALFVIAVLPAIGEEIVFRGIIQNLLQKLTSNPHVAIWIAAILFSAIHIQFFGFVPRLLLGALFGYIYYWSGNLWLAVLAHFVNNGVSVIAIYFYQQGTVTYDLESPESVPMNVVIISAVISSGLLYYIYNYYKRKPFSNPL